MECFFCTCPNSEERKEIAARMFEYWQDMPINLHVLTPESLQVSSFDFQRWRRIHADQEAKSSIYMLIDDDCMLPADMLDIGRIALEDHRDFAIIAAWPTNANIGRWTPPGEYVPFEDLDVIEHHDVGQIRWCRKGVLTAWPPQTRVGYDAEHCTALRALGWRVGYAQHARHIHYGEGHTDLWNQDVPIGRTEAL